MVNLILISSISPSLNLYDMKHKTPTADDGSHYSFQILEVQGGSRVTMVTLCNSILEHGPFSFLRWAEKEPGSSGNDRRAHQTMHTHKLVRNSARRSKRGNKIERPVTKSVGKNVTGLKNTHCCCKPLKDSRNLMFSEWVLGSFFSPPLRMTQKQVVFIWRFLLELLWLLM